MAIFYTSSCQTGSHIVYVKEIPMMSLSENPWYRQLWLENQLNQLTLPYLYHHTFIEVSYESLWRRTDPVEAKIWWSSAPPAVKLVAILFMSKEIPWHHWKTPWYRWLWLLYSPIPILRYQFPCDFDSKLPWQKNRNPRVRVYFSQNKYGCQTQHP